VPDVNQYFPAEAIENARQVLTRCVERAEGVGMVVGPSGTGKTLLCHVLAEQFRHTLAIALLASGRLSTRSALYQAILYVLGRSYRGMDEGELRLALVDYLTTCDQRPDGLLLLVDEAHTLPLRLLDEIRMLTNLVCNGQSRVRVLLVGGPLLEERFASPKLESFSQRLVARCYLEPFGRDETQRYIRAQIGAAGGDGLQVFTTEAAQAVHHATDGVPRLINQVCDHALLLAHADGSPRIDARRIDEAWGDLQQLPSPWNADETPNPNDGGVIEFGGLDDDEMPCRQESGAGSSAAPSLRLSPTEDEAFDEPAERAGRIERALAELEPAARTEEDAEDEFRPAGTIGPEVEVIFDDWKDPFGDDFEHEEVIVERYAAPVVCHREPAGSASESDVPQTSEGTPAAGAAEAAMNIDPDRRDQAVGKPRGAGVARRHEYRHLFAKLRHA
jgi:type II secretory pathway predicted ATPase ExeA